MRSKLLITSAAALLAGTVFAFGQGATERKEPAQPGASQPGISQGQPGQPKSKATQGAQKEQPRPSTNGQAQENREQGQNRPQGQTQGPNQKDQPRTQGQNQREQNPGRTEGQNQREPQRDQGQTRTPGQNQPGQTQTQGQNPSGGASVTLTTEQRTKIRQSVLEGRNAPRVDKVDFSLNVGTAVPRTVHVVEVPETIVEIHPEWRRFMYFVYNDEIVIVEPQTLKIVAIINV
jgi:hypothetical protein